MIFGLFGGDKKRVAEMIAAARTGDVGRIEQLLSKGTDINAPEPESGDTALLAAVDKDQWATVEFLLTQRPNLSLQDKNSHSPLFLAVSKGDTALAIVNLLLDAGADADLGPSQGSNAGGTPLHLACATGANGCLESLLRHGASSTKQLPSGASPLHTAAIGGNQKTIELLINVGGDVNALSNEKRTPLHHCGITGNVKAAAALIQLGAQVDGKDFEGCTPLMQAVIKNHAEMVKLLLDSGADPDVIVRTDSTVLYPLFVAAMNGYDEVIRILIDKGVNVTAKVEGDPSPVDAAKQNGHESAAKLISAALKRHRAGAKEAHGSAKAMEALWKKIIQVIGQQDQGALRKLTETKHFSDLTPDSQLLVACVLGDTEQAQSMLAAGADPNRKFADLLGGITPLFATVGFAHSVGVARLILEHGGDPNQSWDEGSTVLMEATTDQHLELAELLLSKGANVNARMTDGRTALILAARNGGARCVDLFLNAGADINAVENEHGLGAFGSALNRLDLKLAEHLFNRGAEPNFGSMETLQLAIAEHGSLAFVRALEARGCKLVREDQRGRMAFISAKNPDPEVFDYLLNHGADPNEGNDLGYTPLILAGLNNRPALIRRYLERGDDASVRDIDGETALSLAFEKRNSEAIEALREFHVEEKDYSALAPDTAMLNAAEDGALGTILNLRDEGISINSEDGNGNSPMMLAVKADQLGVVRSLYHLGADINHRNHGGETALSIAKASNSTDIGNSLQEFGALDAMNGELGKAFAELGGVHVWNAGDMMFGRMSHPYKQQPPYEEFESDSDEAASGEDMDDEEFDEDDDDISEEDSANALVETKLDLLGQVLESDQVKEQVTEAVLVQLAQKLDDWRSMHESSAMDDDELAELSRILGLFGLGEEESTRTPLFEAVSVAVRSGAIKIVQCLLAAGADVMDRNSANVLAYDLAVIYDHHKITEILLEQMNRVVHDIDKQDDGGNTALMRAVKASDLNAISDFLARGADASRRDMRGESPLSYAVCHGLNEAVRLLRAAGAERLPADAVSGESLIVSAGFRGALGTILDLIDSGVLIDETDARGDTALTAAEPHPGVVKVLVKRGAILSHRNQDGKTAYMIAAAFNRVLMMRALEELGSPIDQPAKLVGPALVQSMRHELQSALKLNGLEDDSDDSDTESDIKRESDPDGLLAAAFAGDTIAVSSQIGAGADVNYVNDDGHTALMMALAGLGRGDMNRRKERDFEQVIDSLLVAGADPNKGLMPPLIMATTSGRLHLVNAMIRAGADVNVTAELPTDEVSGTSNPNALFFALSRRDDKSSVNERVAISLVRAGTNLSFASNDGSLAVHYAAKSGVEKILSEILSRAPDTVNAQDREGLTPLMLAASNNRLEAIRVLLECRADRYMRDAGGRTAAEIAVAEGHQEAATALA